MGMVRLGFRQSVSNCHTVVLLYLGKLVFQETWGLLVGILERSPAPPGLPPGLWGRRGRKDSSSPSTGPPASVPADAVHASYQDPAAAGVCGVFRKQGNHLPSGTPDRLTWTG